MEYYNYVILNVCKEMNNIINYKRCSDVEMDSVYRAFKVGYSDYIIKIDMPKDDFEKRFFRPEGNSLENSFIAFDNDTPVGLILGGIKQYEGIKTLRCGTFAVHPDYRGKGISSRLFELHKQEGIGNGCKQLFLEVIVGNDRAINFYKKAGYKKIYDISYFTLNDITCLNENIPTKILIKKISNDILIESMKENNFDHLCWQNDADYIQKLVNMSYYGAYLDGKLIGSICLSPSGKVFYIFVEKKFRLKGIGLALMNIACKDKSISKLTINFSNNSSIEGFIRHIGFVKDSISQYEMYLTL